MKIILPLLLLVLSGCASTPEKITAVPSAVIPITNPTIVTDLQSAAYNLDSAVTIGALDANDPAPVCLHAILVKTGIEIPPGAQPAASFQPKQDGVASAGAIAYILAQQAKKAVKGVSVDPSCEALVGRIVIDGVTAVNKALPSVLTKVLP